MARRDYAPNHHITGLFPITDLAGDGAQRQLLELVRGLDKGRFKPIVLTLHPGGALEQDFRAVPGLEVTSLEQKGKYDLLCLLRVISLLRQRKVDFIQPFLTPATFFGLMAAMVHRTPVKIVTERLGPGRKGDRLGYRLYLKMEDILSRFVDWAVPNSEAGKDFLVQRGIRPDRVKVIYNGVNLERLTVDEADVFTIRRELGIQPTNMVVGIVARLFPQKRHDIFIRAADIVARAIPDTRFIIVGDGPLRSSLEELRTELGLTSRVVFVGAQQNVGAYISVFDIATLTSDTEGCSNSLLEAMALGKPVVATDVGGNRELIRHGANGLLVPAGNAPAMAENIINLLQNPATARAMGQRARDRVIDRFSVRSMVHQYETLYEKTLVEKAGG